MAGVLPDPPIKNRPVSKTGAERGVYWKLEKYPANHLSGPLPRKGSGSGAEQPAIVFDHILIVLTISSCLNV